MATAVQEDVDAVGLSVLSGAHNYLFGRVLDLLKEKGADDIAVFGGGIIPQEDIQALKALGVKELFTPGTSTQDIIRFVRENISRRVGSGRARCSRGEPSDTRKESRVAARMNFDLTPEQQEVRALARDFAEREVAPVIRHFDEAQEFPHEIMAKLAGTGLWARWCPRSTAARRSTTSPTPSRWRS